MTLEELALIDPTVKAWHEHIWAGYAGPQSVRKYSVNWPTGNDWLSLVALLVTEKQRLQKQVSVLSQQIALTQEVHRGEDERTPGPDRTADDGAGGEPPHPGGGQSLPEGP